MSVSITWSLSDDGSAITSLDHGSGSNGDLMTATEIFVRHDGSYQITNCKFWLDSYSSSYTGGASAVADLAEVLGWADTSVTDDFGGLFVSMDKENNYPTWPTAGTPSGTGYSCFRSGLSPIGTTAANGVVLSELMSASMATNGQIPSAVTDASFKCRIKIPTNEDTTGIRQLDTKLRFTYTS